MALTKEDFKNVRAGDWIRIEYQADADAECPQVSGVVSVSGQWVGIDLAPGCSACIVDIYGVVLPIRIIEHRPVKRVPKVGDVIERDEWDRYDWPEGLTRLATPDGCTPDAYALDGRPPRYVESAVEVLTNWPVTVVQLPTPAPRILTTVTEVDALPVGSRIVDRMDWVYTRKDAAPCGWTLSSTGAACQGTSDMDFPITVLREGEAAS